MYFFAAGFEEFCAKHVNLLKEEDRVNGEGERRIMMSETTRRPNEIKERHTHTYSLVSVNHRRQGQIRYNEGTSEWNDRMLSIYCDF